MQLKFTHQSLQDLDDIWDYIAQENQDAADGFIDMLREKCRMLSETPEMGRERPEISNGVRSFPVGSYQIFYQIRNNALIIVRLLSGYRDIPALFGK
jgi:toxin ParE1/3/4